MRRVPEWLEQVVGGLRDGKDWFVRELQTLPILVRAIGWLVFQAILFKVQPWIWRSLMFLFGFVGTVGTLPLQTQLLLFVIALLPMQTAVLSYRLNNPEGIVVIMENTESDSTGGAVTDGGTPPDRNEKERQLNTSGFGAVLGLLSGAALGSIFGPAGAIGVAVLGAMLGDEYERRKTRKTRIVVREVEK